MNKAIFVLASLTFFTACSQSSGFEVDELAQMCAEGNGKLVSSALVKAADGSIDGKIKVDNSGTVLDFKCSSDKDGGWGVELINDATDSDAAAESEPEADTAAAPAVEDPAAPAPKGPVEQVMARYKADGFTYVSSEVVSLDDKKFSILLTAKSPRGSTFTYACDGDLVDGIIKNEYCEQG
jgi:hypothetical protein